MKGHYYEAGIYIALGTPRWKIVFCFTAEVIMISIMAFAILSILGYVFVTGNGRNVINAVMEFLGLQFRNEEAENKAMRQLFSMRSLICSGISVMAITVFTTLLSSVSIVCYNVRRLFMES